MIASLWVLPVAPRPREGELLSSWRERVACRYGVGGAELAAYLGAPPGNGFPSQNMDGDFSPDREWLQVWATACRVDEGVLQALALSRVSPLRTSWMRAAGAAKGALRAAVCLACLDADANAGDHFIRADWMRVETFACRRHARLLSDVCGRCLVAGEGWRFRLFGPNARLACVRCDCVLRTAGVIGSAENSGFHAALADLSIKLRSLFDAMTPVAAEVLDTVRRLWLRPALRSGARMPAIARFLEQRPTPSLQARVDRAAPLPTLPWGWRTATLIAVAQILDIGAARRDCGAPVFGLASLKEWTDEGPLERAPRGRVDLRPLAAAREQARYRAMAGAILASDDWRQGQDRSPAERRRLLGRLMVQALDPASLAPGDAPDPAATSRKTRPTGGRRAGSARALSPVAPRSRAG